MCDSSSYRYRNASDTLREDLYRDRTIKCTGVAGRVEIEVNVAGGNPVILDVRIHKLHISNKCGILFKNEEEITMKFTAVFQKFPEGYAAFIEELPGANTQGKTLEEARKNLSEAVELVLETNRQLAEETMEGQDVIRESFLIPA